MARPPRSQALFSPRSAKPTPISVVVQVINVLASLVGLTALILAYGFVRYPRDGRPVPIPLPLSTEWIQFAQYLAIGGFVVALWIQILFLPGRKFFLKEHLVELILSLGAAGGLVLVGAGPDYLTAGQTQIIRSFLLIYLVIHLLVKFIKFNTWLVTVMVYPARAILFGFALVILLGALLLSLPAATYSDRFPDFGNNFVDHLFTSTSAVCVTGLIVRDTAVDYTPFGHVILVLLIQAGGLGIIIFGTLFALLLGRQITLQEAILMKDLYSQKTVGQIGKIVKFIVLFTLLIEAVGAVLLYPLWDTPNVAEKIFKSYFHATSAFCNAGFALQSNNLISFAGNWRTYGVIATLIILGGLGFPVISNLLYVVKRRWLGFGRPKTPLESLDQFRVTALTLQSKIVLVTTGALILGGMLALFAIERPTTGQRWGRSVQYEDVAIQADAAVMRNHGPFQRLLDAYFLSVTARTAGFNTVDTTSGKLHPATFLVLIGLMFIGGSPASTAGGIKTVTFVILIAAVVAAFRQRPKVEMFRRTIDNDLIRRAFILVLVYAAVVWTIAMLLAWTHPQIGYLDLLFETTSACGTVGLSTGITPRLNLIGRLLIIGGMFAGRLGPLTLLFAMAGAAKRVRYEYPREGLITG